MMTFDYYDSWWCACGQCDSLCNCNSKFIFSFTSLHWLYKYIQIIHGVFIDISCIEKQLKASLSTETAKYEEWKGMNSTLVFWKPRFTSHSVYQNKIFQTEVATSNITLSHCVTIHVTHFLPNRHSLLGYHLSREMVTRV